MKLNKFAVAFGLASTLVAFGSFAADEGYTGAPTQGEIQFQGELVNSACGLTPASSPVVVDFGQIPTSALANGQTAGNVQKNIELQDCDTTTAKTATVTYMPNTIDPLDGTLAAFTSGTAAGAGIGLKDNASQDVKWGTAMTPVQLVNGTNKIPFVAYLKANDASGKVAPTPGSFMSTINFQIDYQ